MKNRDVTKDKPRYFGVFERTNQYGTYYASVSLNKEDLPEQFTILLYPNNKKDATPTFRGLIVEHREQPQDVNKGTGF